MPQCSTSCRTEVCYPFGRKHGRHWAVKRRAFITLLGGAAAAWPLAASAQERMRKVGLLMGIESDPDARTRVKAFRQRLAELGWSEDRNILTLDVSSRLEPLAEAVQVRRISRYPAVEESDHRHRRLLRTRHKRPRCRCAA